MVTNTREEWLMQAREDKETERRGGRTMLSWLRGHKQATVETLMVAVLLSLVYALYFIPRARLFIFAVPVTRAPIHAKARPGNADVAPVQLDSMIRLVDAEVRRGGFPGAALIVGEGDQLLLEAGIGRTGWSRFYDPVDPGGTLYDLASLTKVVGTTTAVMLLVQDGKLRLDDPVHRWLPTFTEGGRDSVTVRQLLTHMSGLPAGLPTRKLTGATPQERVRKLIQDVRLRSKPGEYVNYSDIGFIVLGEVARQAAGESLATFLKRRVWQPLGMNATRFEPGVPCDSCAPTLDADSAGVTNDPIARKLGTVVGNASLFSSASNMARFTAMLAHDGELDGVRIFRPEIVREFVRPQPRAGTRALGFEVFCREGTVPDGKGCKAPFAYGHTGYTGTSIWIDPRRGIWVVLLSNRTFDPHAPNQIRELRRRLFMTAIADPYTPPELEPDSVE
jgi:CubicO group peptidase (beta-lactamase class C family)